MLDDNFSPCVVFLKRSPRLLSEKTDLPAALGSFFDPAPLQQDSMLKYKPFSLSWSSQPRPKAIKSSPSALLGVVAKQKRTARYQITLSLVFNPIEMLPGLYSPGRKDQERLKTALAKTDGSFIKWLNRIKKAHLIILDDFGLQPISQQVKLALLQIIEDRYENASTNLLLSVTRVQMARILRRTNHRRRFTRQNHSESAPNRTQRK